MRASDAFRQAAHAIWEANYAHPFVQAIGDGTLSEEHYRFYLAQDYVYLIDFSRFFALGAAKAPNLPSMERFGKLLDETLHFEMELHRNLCAEFGLSRQELERTRPSPTCLAYTRCSCSSPMAEAAVPRPRSISRRRPLSLAQA